MSNMYVWKQSLTFITGYLSATWSGPAAKEGEARGKGLRKW
jgi:hypothetical protein